MKIQSHKREARPTLATQTWDGIAGENGIASNGFRVNSGIIAGDEWMCRQENQSNWTGKKVRACTVCDKYDDAGNPLTGDDTTTITCGELK